jgi:asparagine N-glycosylation enzyme membrane subunit Stt3
MSKLCRIALTVIVLFSIFLRYEDFSAREIQKENFQYVGEYQMANFDSYYYLNIAKAIQKGTYDGLQENRSVPIGMKSPFVPPLLSVFAATINRETGIPLSTVAIFLTIFLASLLAPLIFLICMRLSFNKISSLTAALFSIISLTYVIRTRIGVFDTDCLYVLLILLNSYLFFRFAKSKNNKRYKYFALGLLSTIFSYTWWNTANSIVVLSAIAPLFVAMLFFIKTKKIF